MVKKYMHTTIYWRNEEIAKAVRAAKINVSRVTNDACEALLLGNNQDNLERKIQILKQEKKGMEANLAVLNSQLNHLTSLHQKEMQTKQYEHDLFARFLNHVIARIKQCRAMNIEPELHGLKNLWMKDYFPNNGITVDTVQEILEMVDTDRFGFDDFMGLRKGFETDDSKEETNN